jgi:hypothetical protein
LFSFVNDLNFGGNEFMGLSGKSNCSEGTFRMEAESFVNTLKGLSYQDAKLSSEALEWVFISPSTKAFLKWIRNSLASQNLLRDAELKL